MKNGGIIKLELYPDKAPNTVNNFISLANSKFYDGLKFHRIEAGFVIQGGDPDGEGTGGPGYTIKGEFADNGFTQNDLKHTTGVISMARKTLPLDSAGSQFFIMLADIDFLDGKYAAFGKVIEGIDVVNKIVSDFENGKTEDYATMKTVRVDTFKVKYPAPIKIN
ncbi:MAG: peptidylprolyl isomerase [Oscillospiraceae bacterium]|nr:peptidylprolyl isomerase [Oscillospiraceae bacterium]